jgi:hypothetical protein
MKKIYHAGVLLSLVALLLTLHSVGMRSQNKDPNDEMKSKIQRGFALAPVPLNLKGKDPALVGLGSYIVNAQAGCNDCHSCPSYKPGHSPFEGGDGQLDSDHYLAGGVPFPAGPVTLYSRNITPDASGKPAGLSFEDFLKVIQTGVDPESSSKELLQVMPWPVYRNMSTRELRAIYEFLSAIPSATPGGCFHSGQ